MIAQVLQRMNRREQVLAGLVALVVFFLANLFLWSWLFRAIGDSRVEVAKRKQAHNEQTVLLRESDLWSKREQWLREHQPVFHGASDASALLDQLKQIAGKHNVLIKTLPLAIAPRWARINQYSLPSKPKVRGRRRFIFFTTCKHLMLSLFLRAQ